MKDNNFMVDQDGGYYFFENEDQKQASIEHWERGCPSPEFMLAYALDEEETHRSHIKLVDFKEKFETHLKVCKACQLGVGIILCAKQ